MPLEPSAKLFDSVDADTCNAYRACRDHVTKEISREYLEQAVPRTAYLVGDREEHFLKAFRSQFHDKAWEILVLDDLHRNGVELIPTKPEGPDVCGLVCGRKVWIEAKTIGAGEGLPQDRVPQRGSGSYVGPLFAEELLTLRQLGAIHHKQQKIAEYRAKGIIGHDDVALLAIGYGRIKDADLHDRDWPCLPRTVYGVGDLRVIVPIDSPQNRRSEHAERKSIQRAPDAEGRGRDPIKADIFCDDALAHIGGILYSAQLNRMAQQFC